MAVPSLPEDDHSMNGLQRRTKTRALSIWMRNRSTDNELDSGNLLKKTTGSSLNRSILNNWTKRCQTLSIVANWSDLQSQVKVFALLESAWTMFIVKRLLATRHWQARVPNKSGTLRALIDLINKDAWAIKGGSSNGKNWNSITNLGVALGAIGQG